MPWPLSQDYNEALQNPQSSFNDPELRQGQVVVNALGIPQPCSGNFADVYAVECAASKTKWAVKCFTREVHGLRERYSKISSYLKKARLPFTVDFQYLEQGIRIAGRWYPVLKMHWVEGATLNAFVRNMLDKPSMLEKLSRIWVRLAHRLREAKLSHCDLQHGNVLLVPDSEANAMAVKLIDYDGMWVPALAKTPSGEFGHSAYQHPQRLSARVYNAEVDRFPLLAVHIALRALIAGGRQLWERYDTGDNMLFRQADFDAPATSSLFAELLRMNQADIRDLSAKLIDAARKPLERTPHLADLVADEKPSKSSAIRSKVQSLSRADTTAAPEPNAFEGFEAESSRRGRRRRIARSSSLLAWIVGGSVAACAAVGGVLLCGLPTGGGSKKPSTQAVPAQAQSAEATPAPDENDPPRPSTKPNDTPVKPAEAQTAIPDGPPGEVQRFEGMPGVYNMAFSPDGQRFLTTHKDASVYLWDTATGKEIHILKGHRDVVWSAVFSADGKRAVSASSDKTVRLWNLETGKQIRAFMGHSATVFHAVFSPDGRQLLSGSDDGSVRLWDGDSGREIRSYKGNVGAVYQVTFSPDGARVVSGGFDRLLHVWDKDTGKELSPCHGSTAHVYRLAFSADGRLLAAGGAENEVRIWRIANRSLLHTLGGNSGPVIGLRFSPDGRQLVSVTKAGEAQAWDVASGRELGRYYGPQGAGMVAAAVSADGRYFLSAGTDNIARFWRLPSPDAMRATSPFVFGTPPKTKPTETVVQNKPSPSDKPEPTPNAGKLPVPDEAARKKATDDIRDIYKADYASLQKADDRIDLAVKLLKRGADKDKDPVSRFAYLCEARDQAARGGDVELSLKAIDELTQTFAVAPLPMKTVALELAAKAPQKPEAAKKLVEQSLTIANEAESADDYDLAAKLLKIAVTAAYQAGDRSWRDAVTQRENRLKLLRADYAKIADAVKTLAGKAEDAAANLTVGKFECFVKEDWTRGLPMLARSQDTALADLARKDIEEPAAADERAALGQAWSAFADKQSHAGTKKAARKRGKYWLYAALQSLKGREAERLGSQLEIKVGKARLRPGLIAELFQHQAFEKRIKGRLDYNVDFDWGFDRPDAKAPVDDFSIRWQGVLFPPRAGRYTLIVEHDDGIRLKLTGPTGTTVMDRWGKAGRDSKDVVLSERPYTLQLEFHEINGPAHIHLRWSLLGGFPEQTIPTDALFHEVKQERLLAP